MTAGSLPAVFGPIQTNQTVFTTNNPEVISSVSTPFNLCEQAFRFLAGTLVPPVARTSTGTRSSAPDKINVSCSVRSLALSR